MQRHRPLNQRRAFAAWLATRPASVRAIARTITPYRFYRIRRTGQVGQVIAFHDDGLLRVLVHEAPHGTPAEVLVPFCVEDVPWRAVDPPRSPPVDVSHNGVTIGGA